MADKKIINQSDYSSDFIIQTLIINVKILSKLQVGERPLFYGKYIQIQANSYLTSIIRYLFNQSRENVTEGLTRLHQNCIDVLTNPSLSKFHADLILELKNMNNTGLKNLADTYRDDPVTFSLLEYINKSIASFINHS